MNPLVTEMKLTAKTLVTIFENMSDYAYEEKTQQQRLASSFERRDTLGLSLLKFNPIKTRHIFWSLKDGGRGGGKGEGFRSHP